MFGRKKRKEDMTNEELYKKLYFEMADIRSDQIGDNRRIGMRLNELCETNINRGEELLSKINTHAIVAELRTREGVEVSTLAPTMDACIQASGPAIVLVVID